MKKEEDQSLTRTISAKFDLLLFSYNMYYKSQQINGSVTMLHIVVTNTPPSA